MAEMQVEMHLTSNPLRHLMTKSTEELDAFLNKLQPTPENVTLCCQKEQFHCFVNDIGLTGM